MYVFDTDILSLLMKGRLPSHGRARMAAVDQERAAMTSITLGELHYGARRSQATRRWLATIAQVRSVLRVLPFDAPAAERYGDLRAELERQGRRLDDPDLRIAAICVAGGHTLVSGNERHFARVPGLQYENWLAQAR